MPSMNIMMRMMQKKNKMIEDAKEAVRIKEEEEITKRNVKTIMDVEAAQLEREKLQENRYCLQNGYEQTFSKTIQAWTQIHILELQLELKKLPKSSNGGHID